jgi:hypothetical protein
LNQPFQQPKKPRSKSKERSLPKPTNTIVNNVIGAERTRLTTAEPAEDVKGEVIRGVINVQAFPPTQAVRSDCTETRNELLILQSGKKEISTEARCEPCQKLKKIEHRRRLPDTQFHIKVVCSFPAR